MWKINHRTKKFSFFALFLSFSVFTLLPLGKAYAAAPVPFTVNTDLTTCTENWLNPVHTGVISSGNTFDWSNIGVRGAFYKSNAGTNPYVLYFGIGFNFQFYASGTNKLYPYMTNTSGSTQKLWRAWFNSSCEMQSITFFNVSNAAANSGQQMEEAIAISHYSSSSEYVAGALPITFPYQNTQAVPAWSFADPPTPEPSEGGGGMTQDEMIEVFAIFSGFGLCVLIAYSILKQFVVGYHA